MNQDAKTRSQRAVRQLLESWQRSGVTYLRQMEPLPELPAETTSLVEAPREKPVQTVAPTTPLPRQSIVPPPQPTETSEEPTLESEQARKEMSVPRTTKSKMNKGDRQAELDILATQVSKCTRCPELAETRTQTVFGVGNPRAKIMFIGEAPGADEDKQGEPFVGRAGKLLDKIIEACQMKRSDIYIANILRCRPPGNRNPTDLEASNCRGYLDAQIEIVDPDYIVCWGSVAAKNLLHSDLPIGKMRGDFYEYGRAKVVCTYHPSYLLRNPSAKKNVWEDMIYLFADMGINLKAQG
ncbi:uracil-DNA glycosylase [Gimesia maris]|jgi:DNA polymerase|uniref:Type-4 uracil-DNA glycosylase n=1 Tax=Gimesia maris TaxID=122 RepID=A0A3D3RFT1_9PLAN|nr:uracil-DNA glycosylase [Gimesia maris]MAC51242.1 uracil-DNA glycosylase [Gimesia sp.]QDT79999.1 Uracil DNA glycosylase superfamily protein [Gimesia maris]HCO27486.1 uracil-DNA glycosylase [Gimesia maris]|tara:strand:- start:20317 stop:21204 length:888 start_codon:yes stop_codon:yes gene_type:complete